MIVTAILGSITLMATMFIGIRYFLDDVPTQQAQESTAIKDKPTVPFNSTILGVVKYIEEDIIHVFDIEKEQEIIATILPSTEIRDSSNRLRQKEDLQVGEIFRLVYALKDHQLKELTNHPQSWIKSDMKNMHIDLVNHQVGIGQNNYLFDEHTLVFDTEGELTTIEALGEYDVLELRGIDRNIYSIRVLHPQGYIVCEDLPALEGVLEININRQLPLANATQPIPLSVGEHKIVIRLEGYNPKVYHVTVEPGETYNLSIDDLERTMIQVHIEGIDQEVDYTIKISDQTFKKGDPIVIESGTYHVEVLAEGHKPWVRRLPFAREKEVIQVDLEPIPGWQETQGATASKHQVHINTDPIGAKVYLNDQYVGMSPYVNTLAQGDYRIRLEKENYETYETQIIIDHSDSQNEYLYHLNPR